MLVSVCVCVCVRGVVFLCERVSANGWRGLPTTGLLPLAAYRQRVFCGRRWRQQRATQILYYTKRYGNERQRTLFRAGPSTKKKHLNVIYYLNSDTNCLALRIKLAASPATQRAFVLVAFRLRWQTYKAACQCCCRAVFPPPLSPPTSPSCLGIRS